MSIRRFATLAILFLSTAAAAAPASDATIRELMAVTQQRKILEGMRSQFDAMMNGAIQQALKGKAPNAKQQKAIDRMRDRMLAVLKDTTSWEKAEPIYLRLYRESFTEEEIAGMLSFYQTPAGQAVINKMPILVQKSVGEIQKLLAAVSPQMQKIDQDFVAEMKAAGN